MERGRSDRPVLHDVTLVAVTSVAIEATVSALHASMRQCEFAEVILLTDRAAPANMSGDIALRAIERLRSTEDYSRFMLRKLGSHVSTSHALCIQWDGFVSDGRCWQPGFLEFDYIGAVWPHVDPPHNVGNGGFSLRSRRLLLACRDLAFDGSCPEDIVIGRQCRPELERLGMKFAPQPVAEQFAYERGSPTGREFGFHGAYNLPRHLGAAQADRLLRSIEPNMLTQSERREILAWAVRQRRFGLALQFAARLLRGS